MAQTFHAEARLRVRYAETDQMGVVYHANYLVWFEVGRVELLRSLGIPYKQLEEEHGRMIAVVGAEVRYRAPARYDDEIAVRTSLLAMRGPVLKIGYQVVRVSDGKLLCDGKTTHVVVDRQMTKQSLPEPYLRVFQGLLRDTSTVDDA
ncbi:MAG: acyl-CoA thioesterase [Janthinobacterium lividum]